MRCVSYVLPAVVLLVLAACAATAEAPPYRLISSPQESARESAERLLRLLAQGDIEAAAKLSNAPKRRYEVLRDFRESVGHEQFRRVFARYLAPGNRLLAEAAIGDRRLLIWELGEADGHLAGQYFVRIEDRFLLDDIPNDGRSQLQQVLESYRKRTNR